MPIYADPARGPAVRLVADDDMTLLAQFVASSGARPVAQDLAAIPEADLHRLAELVVRDLPGVRVVTGVDEAAEMVKLGGEVLQASTFMGRLLQDEAEPPDAWAAPTLPDGLTIQAVDTGDVERYHRAQLAAYPKGHPDHRGTVSAYENGFLQLLLSGQSKFGPILSDPSAEVVDAHGALVAAVLVFDWDGGASRWPGGPFVVDLLRTPAVGGDGVGRALLQRAISVSSLAEFGGIGLAVTELNPARRLYESLGFTDMFHQVTLDLPGTWPPTRPTSGED